MDNSDFIVDFYIMYTHENLQNPVDKASLQQIAKAYGTPNFIEQLQKEGPLSIYPPEVISHYNRDFLKNPFLPFRPLALLEMKFIPFDRTIEEEGLMVRIIVVMYFVSLRALSPKR